MKRRTTIGTITFLTALSLLAQSKLDPRTVLFTGLGNGIEKATALADSTVGSHRKALHRAPVKNSSGLMEVLITLNNEITEEELEALGVVNPVVLGDVAAGSISPDNLSALEENPAIKGISVSGKPQLRCDYARKDTGVDIIRETGEGLPQKYDGSGVIVSLFDQGIETTHINFLSPDRTENRIRGVWKYDVEYLESGNTSTTEYYYSTPEEINEFRTDDANQTHGTHTLGIMAGSFGVNKEDPEHDYSGMAPASDILVGCGSIAYANVLRALKRFYNYANEAGKPLVVNLSFGDNIGPHDGTDAFPKALDNIAEKIPVFMSSGNEGLKKIAINKTFSETSNTVKTVISPTALIRNHLGASWEAACEVQVWSEDETPFTIETGLWDKENNQWLYTMPVAADGLASYIANGIYASLSNDENEDFDYLYEDSAIGLSTGLDPNNNRYTADIWYLLKKQLNHIDRNIIPVLIVTGQPGKRVDVYVDGDYNEFTTGKMEDWIEGAADGSISNIACGKNTIAVGSYCTRAMTTTSTEGEVSNFTSWGILPDGRVLPDILAPGDCIASSMSTPFTESDYYSENAYPAVYGMMYGENNPFYWTALQGTSQASPAMAGIAALWLQAYPELTPAELKEIMAETARPTGNMTPQCGAGKVNALEGLKKVIKLSSVEKTFADAPETLLFVASGNEYAIHNALNEPFEASVYDMTGKCVLHLTSADGEAIVFNKSALSQSGVYLIVARSEKETLTKKIFS